MEQVYIELANIEVTFLDKVVLDIPKLSVYQFDRIGIVGRNGVGKSTLLKLLAGKLKPTSGTVQHYADFGYFEQIEAPINGEADYELLSRLSVQEADDIHSLSGGEQTRLKLAQLLSTYHVGMLVDEPTTHLDADGIQFFIDELRHYYGALVLISHDRYVLDELITKIWEVADGKITEYKGNYADYLQQKEIERQVQLQEYEKNTKEKNRLLQAAEEKMKKAEKITQANKRMSKKEVKTPANRMFMTKSKDTGQKAFHRAAKAMEQRVEQLGTVEAPKEERALRFRQSKAIALHNKYPIMGEQVTLAAGEKILLEEVSFQFPLGKTIAITGKNGTGKTTLLKYILENGEGITMSPKAIIGRFQQMSYQFTKNETIMEFMKAHSDYPEGMIRTVLHSMNFTGNDMSKNVHDISGGEAVRLLLCKLFLGSYNILVLDEPTNFLDILCVEALERFIHAYDGTVILVSHDRQFVEKVADEVYVIEDTKLRLR